MYAVVDTERDDPPKHPRDTAQTAFRLPPPPEQPSVARANLPTAGMGGAHIMQIGERDVFGESSFFSGGAHAADAAAVADVEVLAVPRAGFDELLQASRPVAWKIAMNAAGILGVRLQETDDWLAELLQEEEDARIAQSWQRFRENAGRGSFTPHRFFGT